MPPAGPVTSYTLTSTPQTGHIPMFIAGINTPPMHSGITGNNANAGAAIGTTSPINPNHSIPGTSPHFAFLPVTQPNLPGSVQYPVYTNPSGDNFLAVYIT